jgi:hypothetical protein
LRTTEALAIVPAVPERLKRGLLESVLSSVDGMVATRKRLVDVILMVSLADSFVSDAELERIAESIGQYGELNGVSFDYIYPRIEELQLTAPLFSEEREHLVRELTDPRARRLSLALAAKLIGESRPLAEEERAMLVGLADAFKIPEAEHPSLFAPWSRPAFGDASTYQLCGFNSPERTTKKTFFEAMGGTENEAEFKMLAHKVTSTRHLITKSFEGAEILAVGEMIRVGPYAFHSDAIIEHSIKTQQEVGYQRHVTRFLAPREALHPLEHSVLATLAHRLDDNARILIVHTGDLSSQDRVFLQGFDPNVLRAEHLEAGN